MRTYRPSSGPLREAPFYTPKEIEDVCTDELRRVGLFPAKPEPVRIERFIEKKFGVHPEYADLPEGVLGYTKFGSNGVEEIVIARALVEQGRRSAERQANTTLAHEAGHGLLQGHLFALAGTRLSSLFEGQVDPATPKILCRNPPRHGNRGYDGRWWEFQANQAIGALLLPRPLVVDALENFLEPTGTMGHIQLLPAQRDDAARCLADVFDVNPVVARIRLEEIFPAGEGRQLTF